MPKSTPQGQTNPEFIGDDDDDNDIYKAQLLLFLKQAHLIRPNIYPDEQDNQSDTSEYSRSTSRKPSAVSRTSDKIEEDKDEPAHDVETSHVSNNSTVPVSFLSCDTRFRSRGICNVEESALSSSQDSLSSETVIVTRPDANVRFKGAVSRGFCCFRSILC